MEEQKMKFKEQALRIATLLGTFLLLAPIIFMLILSIFPLVKEGKLLIDFLIPLEVFPIVLAGTGILTLIACKTNIYKKRICSMAILLVIMFVGGQYIAVLTGIADGGTPATGWPLIIVFTSIIIFDVLTVIIGIHGIYTYKKLRNQT
jgi:hypothetical protein